MNIKYLKTEKIDISTPLRLINTCDRRTRFLYIHHIRPSQLKSLCLNIVKELEFINVELIAFKKYVVATFHVLS